MEYNELFRLIRDGNVDELAKILTLNSNENKILMPVSSSKSSIFSKIFNLSLHSSFHNFNTLHSQYQPPLLHVAVLERSQKVVEYLLSQPFVDKSICNSTGENIYHVVCSMRGAEQLFSMIERNVPHLLLLNQSNNGINAFQIACKENNIFIVKRVYEILESLKVDLSPITRGAMTFAIKNKEEDIEFIQYISSINRNQLDGLILLKAMKSSTFNIIVYLMNVYLCQSIPSHLHNNQFHIFQFSNHPHNIPILQNNNDNFLYLIESNFKKIMEANTRSGNRIWHEVCRNRNLDVVQFIFSLKGIQPEILNDDGNNVFLIACAQNPNIKVIKYIHKLFPLFIHSQININGKIENAAYLVLNGKMNYVSDKLNIIHYLYLNGIDIHFLSKQNHQGNTIYQSIYSLTTSFRYFVDTLNFNPNMGQYLKVISQDFDYLHNEHDDEAYRKPSFWKHIDSNADEQSIRINEWKNRFDEHVLHHLSKMIQGYV